MFALVSLKCHFPKFILLFQKIKKTLLLKGTTDKILFLTPSAFRPTVSHPFDLLAHYKLYKEQIIKNQYSITNILIIGLFTRSNFYFFFFIQASYLNPALALALAYGHGLFCLQAKKIQNLNTVFSCWLLGGYFLCV